MQPMKYEDFIEFILKQVVEGIFTIEEAVDYISWHRQKEIRDAQKLQEEIKDVQFTKTR